MIKGIKVIAIIDKGKIVNCCYSVSLVDNYKMLPVKELEIPQEMLFTREYLKIIEQYERMDKPNKIKDEIAAKVDEALNNGICTYRFTEIGWNLLDGEPVFAFSNCCVTKTGINYESYANVKGFDLIVSENFQSTKLHAKTSFLELMNILNENLEILYPIFTMNILSLLNGILGIKDKAPALTMWLDGNPGSGKTALACALGNFVNKNMRDHTQEKKKIFSAYNKPKTMVQSLSEHQGINFILDDVKAEKVSGQKDNSKTCVDICIRSVESQKIVQTFSNAQLILLEKTLRAGAIITGEYLDIYKSSLARIVYLNVNNFVNDEQCSKALEKLQNNPYILTNFMVHFIQFLCNKYLAKSYWELIIKKKNKIWEERKKDFYGINCSRLANNLSSLQITSRILQYAVKDWEVKESCNMQSLIQNTDMIFFDIMKNTEFLLNEEDTILLDSFKAILPKLRIQKPEKIVDYAASPLPVKIQPYILKSDKDAIWISNLNDMFIPHKPGIYPALICRLDVLNDLLFKKLSEKISNYGYEGRINSKITNTRLGDAGIICRECRPDNTFNYQFKYVIDRLSSSTQDDYNAKDKQYIDCVCLNLNSDLLKSLVKKLLKENQKETDFNDLDNTDQDYLEECGDDYGQDMIGAFHKAYQINI